MIQQEFAKCVADSVKQDSSAIGLAVGGSWITNELDEFSDLDLVLVTRDKIGGDREKMLEYAKQYGKLLTGFTGEHVGEPRLLICLYSDPLLHVDIKFVTLDEFGKRVETPVILVDKDGQLANMIRKTEAVYPQPDYQWIEDRFWIWIHYLLLKIGRGEYFEALDMLSFIRLVVLGPLLHIGNNGLPRGVRHAESRFNAHELTALKSTIAGHDRGSLLAAAYAAVGLYRTLRQMLFNEEVTIHHHTEEAVLAFFQQIKSGG